MQIKLDRILNMKKFHVINNKKPKIECNNSQVNNSSQVKNSNVIISAAVIESVQRSYTRFIKSEIENMRVI